MRLIDADKLNINDMCDHCRSACCGDCIGNDDFVKWIESQPTAYDPDKIVDQLKVEYKPIDTTRRNGKTLRMGFNNGIARAIEIVKGGTE